MCIHIIYTRKKEQWETQHYLLVSSTLALSVAYICVGIAWKQTNTCASSNIMVLLHNSFAIPMKYQQSTVMAQSQYIRTQIPYTLQVKRVERAIGWLWNWPKGGSAGNKQWLLRQWKRKQYRISQQEELHGCHERYLGARSDVCRDMLPGVDQGQFVLSVWSLPFGPGRDFHQSVIHSWEDGVPEHRVQVSLATLPLQQASSPWWNAK